MYDEEFQNPISTSGFITRYIEEIEVLTKRKKEVKSEGGPA